MRDTRRDMVLSAVEVLRERGADGVTLDAVLSRSGAPRGSIYHHFPAGRRQILDEAVQFAGDAIAELITRGAEEGSAAILAKFTSLWKQLLVDSDYTAGCPVVSVSVSATTDSALIEHASAIFTHWCEVLQQAFLREGHPPAIAARLATMSIAAVEGAVVMCRAQRSAQPLDDTTAELAVFLAARALFGTPRPAADSFDLSDDGQPNGNLGEETTP